MIYRIHIHIARYICLSSQSWWFVDRRVALLSAVCQICRPAADRLHGKDGLSLDGSCDPKRATGPFCLKLVEGGGYSASRYSLTATG